MEHRKKTKKRLNFWIDAKEVKMLEFLCKQKKVSKTQMVRDLIMDQILNHIDPTILNEGDEKK